MANTLGPGDVRVGHLLDGVDDGFPDQSATLTFNEKRGAELTVPYLWETEGGPNPQYLKARRWFDINDGTLPETLIFQDDKGTVTLTDAHASGHSLGVAPVGRVRCQAAIFNRPRTYQDEYLVHEFISTIDGLEEFARFSPVTHSDEKTEAGRRRTTIVIDAAESVEWEASGFKYAIRSNVAWHGTPGRSFVIDDSSPFLSTTSDSGATLANHLEAQWAVRALLILVHGRPLAWRSHKIRDEEFPLWMMDGSDRGPYAVEVQMSNTVEQHRFPLPEANAFGLTPLRLNDLGADGMRKWIELYSDETFVHAVQPAVEVINGATRFLEPQLMMLAISLDRFGYFRFGDRKRRAMHEHILKCLDDANLDWPQIGSKTGIAKAISNMNNDLKHPDREAYPDTDALAGVTRLAEVIVRAQLFDLLGIENKLRERFLSYNDARNAVQIFTDAGITVTDDGELRRNSNV